MTRSTCPTNKELNYFCAVIYNKTSPIARRCLYINKYQIFENSINSICEFCKFSKKIEGPIILTGNIGNFTPTEEKFCVKILVTSVEIGSYCPKYESLIIDSEYYNSSYYSKYLPLILQILQSKFNLTPIQNLEDYLDFTLGVDAEFEQLKTFNSYEVIHTKFSGLGVKIGADGSGAQLELRPTPSLKPMQLVKNIQQLILELTSKGIPLSVRGDRYPLGAHLHIGHPLLRIESNISHIVAELDKFLGSKLINLSGRARGSYKVLGSIRRPIHGIEYRPLPSAYLFTPQFAYIVFELARRILIKYFTNKSDDQFLQENRYLYKKLEKYIQIYQKEFPITINQNWIGNVLILHSKDIFNKTFCQTLQNFIQKNKIKFYRPILIYGLKEDRGNVVAGFEYPNYQKITVPFEERIAPIFKTYGLPYEIRTSENRNKIRKVLKALFENYKKEQPCA